MSNLRVEPVLHAVTWKIDGFNRQGGTNRRHITVVL